RTLLGRLEARAALAAVRRAAAERDRDHAHEELRAARADEQALAAEAALLADTDHRTDLARAEVALRLEAARARALEELGTDPDALVDELGPHRPVPAPGPRGGGARDDGAGFDGADGDAPAPGRPYVRAEQEERLRRAERDLARLGRVNPLALEEFAALEERSAFLADQLDDLRRTRADLLDIVAEVDARVEQVFAEAYADVARAFTGVFARLFPGGEGRLVLTDPGSLLTTGIEVEARPAGKRVKRLSLLSGGERSLAAVALLIAVFTARPSPFYVLDEVEAALDDANLRRLLGVLEELRTTSQLLVVTHQERTMTIADALYGVAMRGDGVSTVVSQRLRQEERGAVVDLTAPALEPAPGAAREPAAAGG
ncbi:MAG: Chromosome partition protein smc, partial [uncultured Quadrisphaera sp.]